MRRSELGLQLARRDSEAGGSAASAGAVETGEPENLVHVPGRVVVAIDRPGDVELPTAPGEVARSAEDRVGGIVRIGYAVAVRVDSPARPGRGHELHPPDRAGR